MARNVWMELIDFSARISSAGFKLTTVRIWGSGSNVVSARSISMDPNAIVARTLTSVLSFEPARTIDAVSNIVMAKEKKVFCCLCLFLLLFKYL
jgi:hypothetical protein